VSKAVTSIFRLVGALGIVELFKTAKAIQLSSLVDKSPFGNIVTLSECMMGGFTPLEPR